MEESTAPFGPEDVNLLEGSTFSEGDGAMSIDDCIDGSSSIENGECPIQGTNVSPTGECSRTGEISEGIDLNKSHQLIETIRQDLNSGYNYAMICERKGHKLLLASTRENRAPDDVVRKLIDSIAARSATGVQKVLGDIRSHEFYIDYRSNVEDAFNSNDVGAMASFLVKGHLNIGIFHERLRNTDFCALTITSLQYLTWAAFPEPEVAVSPHFCAASVMSRMTKYEVQKYNKALRKYKINTKRLIF